MMNPQTVAASAVPRNERERQIRCNAGAATTEVPSDQTRCSPWGTAPAEFLRTVKLRRPGTSDRVALWAAQLADALDSDGYPTLRDTPIGWGFTAVTRT